MKVWKNMLLIAGTNRNVGKTTFACRVIEQISQQQSVVAIKITPHFHTDCITCIPLFESKNLLIAEESSRTALKDSSKMLAAGAKKVYYIQSFDENLSVAMDYLMPLIPNDVAVVCESAALRRIVIPGLFVVMSLNDSISKNSDLIPLADFHLIDFNYNVNGIRFNDGFWIK
ncbi:MAG: hypothetical protein WCX31_16320 [Salinivirgaceae bacterium]|jgi:hypothetical protein